MLALFTLVMVMTAAVMLSLFTLVMVMTAAAVMLVTAFRGAMTAMMHVTVLNLFLRGLAHVLDGHEESQSLSREGMIAIHDHLVIADLLDHHAHAAATGVGFKHITHF